MTVPYLWMLGGPKAVLLEKPLAAGSVSVSHCRHHPCDRGLGSHLTDSFIQSIEHGHAQWGAQVFTEHLLCARRVGVLGAHRA